MKYAKVVIEIGVKNVDKMFIYSIPNEMIDRIKIGIRVKVSFGKQILEGFVLEIFDDTVSDYVCKPILDLIDEEPILNSEMIELGKIMHDTLLCSLSKSYQAMLPKAYKASYKTNMNIKMEKYVVLNHDYKDIDIDKIKYPKQRDLLNRLFKEKEIVITKKDSAINTLLKKNIIFLKEREMFRYQSKHDKVYKKVILNKEQINAVQTVEASFGKSDTFLLYGVTGSGKTEVYINIIKKVLELGKSAIVLVPEISLTPQIVDRFVYNFGDNIAILHSGLSEAEKYDEYRKIRKGLVNIVVGARSAIFAPFKDIGIIIIDEEHSTTYKQDNHPRYDARDIAKLRSKYHKCPVVLGSATPTLESFARAGNHIYKLITLPNRAGNSLLPKVEIVDMKDEFKKGNFILSEVLKNKIREKLDNKEQIILLLNRRGYSSMLTCKKCGYVEKCPRCDISLTYHKSSDMLRCHYCGYAIKRKDRCSNCNSSDIRDFGLGTQKLEEELNKKYSDAKIVRMDVDTTGKKGAHQKIIDSFSNHEFDILVGTQMIAKGLDFPLVTLVGVINADSSLNIPDFRSAERTFQLLCQVSGRAGRGDKNGEVIIQTYNNDHYSITLSKTHNYLEFYKEEMQIRKKLNYSPYYFITLVNINTKNYDYGFEISNKIADYLRNNLSKDSYVLGPSMANPFKINNVYYYNCIIKYKRDANLKKVLLDIDNRFKTDNKVNVEIDINPSHL